MENIKWISKVKNGGYNLSETLTCYNEKNEELIKITIGMYLEVGLKNKRKIYNIVFCKKDCDLIENLEKILSEKLDELRGYVVDASVDYWENRVLSRSKSITSIYNKVKSGKKLNEAELYILYGLYSVKKSKIGVIEEKGYNIGWFGYTHDPRINEILKNRNHQVDFLRFSEKDQIELLKGYKSNDFGLNVKTDNKRVIIESRALQYASDSLLKDPDFIRNYIKKSNVTDSILKYTKENINKNKNIVLLVLQTKSNDDFRYVDESLKNDKEVALTAVRYNGLMYEYVGDVLKSDEDVIVAALLQNMDVVKWINIRHLRKSVKVRNTYEIVSRIRSYSSLSLERKEIVREYLFNLISNASDELKDSGYLMKRAYEINPDVYNLASDKIKQKLKRR